MPLFRSIFIKKTFICLLQHLIKIHLAKYRAYILNACTMNAHHKCVRNLAHRVRFFVRELLSGQQLGNCRLCGQHVEDVDEGFVGSSVHYIHWPQAWLEDRSVVSREFDRRPDIVHKSTNEPLKQNSNLFSKLFRVFPNYLDPNISCLLSIIKFSCSTAKLLEF